VCAARRTLRSALHRVCLDHAALRVDLRAVVPPDGTASAVTLLPFLLDPVAGLPRGYPAVSDCVEAAATFLRRWAPEATALSTAEYRKRQVQAPTAGNE
jgi:hypothetical protein